MAAGTIDSRGGATGRIVGLFVAVIALSAFLPHRERALFFVSGGPATGFAAQAIADRVFASPFPGLRVGGVGGPIDGIVGRPATPRFVQRIAPAVPPPVFAPAVNGPQQVVVLGQPALNGVGGPALGVAPAGLGGGNPGRFASLDIPGSTGGGGGGGSIAGPPPASSSSGGGTGSTGGGSTSSGGGPSTSTGGTTSTSTGGETGSTGGTTSTSTGGTTSSSTGGISSTSTGGNTSSTGGTTSTSTGGTTSTSSGGDTSSTSSSGGTTSTSTGGSTSTSSGGDASSTSSSGGSTSTSTGGDTSSSGGSTGGITSSTGGSTGGMTPPAVPEPGTWAMMIFGFGMIGAMLRRGRRQLPVTAV